MLGKMALGLVIAAGLLHRCCAQHIGKYVRAAGSSSTPIQEINAAADPAQKAGADRQILRADWAREIWRLSRTIFMLTTT